MVPSIPQYANARGDHLLKSKRVIGDDVPGVGVADAANSIRRSGG
jgi:hypothetical protein